jgi:hypothetical protein
MNERDEAEVAHAHDWLDASGHGVLGQADEVAGTIVDVGVRVFLENHHEVDGTDLLVREVAVRIELDAEEYLGPDHRPDAAQ